MKFKRLIVSVGERPRKDFKLLGDPVEGSVQVYWNGLLQTPVTDWTRSGRTVELTVPADDGVIHITYCI